ncbi:MAG: TIGR03016 family PEP-CTERM system-associated outer membrane protein [Gammaproteobacteria bacterium]
MRNNGIPCPLIVCAIGLCFSHGAVAAVWDFAPRIYAAQTYTNNIQLTTDQFAEDEWVTTIAPGITLNGVGDRWNTYLDYEVQGLLFWRDEDRNNVFQVMTGGTEVEAIRERFWISASAVNSQVVIDPTQPFASDNIFSEINRTDAFRFEVSPNWIQPIGRLTEFELQYWYYLIDFEDDEIIASQTGTGDTESNRARASYGSSDEAGRFGWSMFYDYETINYQARIFDVTFEEAAVELNYEVGASTQIFGTYGAESDFSTPTGVHDGGLDAERWSVGVRYRPNDRNSIEVSTGERFFGTTYGANWTYGGTHLTLIADYREGPTTYSREQFQSANPESIDDIPIGDLPAISPLVFLSQRATFDINYTWTESSIYANYFDERRDFVDTRQDDHTMIYGAGWDWRFTPRTTLSLSGSVWNIDGANLSQGQANDRVSVQLGLSTFLNPRSSLGFIVRNLQQDVTNIGTAEIEALSVQVSFTHTFN